MVPSNVMLVRFRVLETCVVSRPALHLALVEIFRRGDDTFCRLDGLKLIEPREADQRRASR